MKPKSSTPSAFSLRLRELRAAAKMTQREVAEHLGIQRSIYAYYETGAVEPSLTLLRRMADEYRVSVGYLLGIEDHVRGLTMRQGTGEPLDGARLMGECEREERAFLSLLRRMDKAAQNKLFVYGQHLLHEAIPADDLKALAAAHIHSIDELFESDDE